MDILDILEYIIYCSNPDLIRSVKCSTFGYGFSKTNGKTVIRWKRKYKESDPAVNKYFQSY